MSTYNDGAFIKEAIDSVMEQTFKDWEFIIVNDASIDDTAKIIGSYCSADKRFKYLVNKKNSGQAASLNKCITLARGEYIAILDSDDTWIDKSKLQKQVDFLEKNFDYGFVGSWAYIVDKNNKIISTLKYPRTDSAIRSYMLIENCFMHDTIVVRKGLLNRVGGYNSELYFAHDYDLWLRLGMVSKMAIMEEYMLNYRKNPKGSTLSQYNQQLQETIKVVRQFKNIYPNYAKAIVFWNLRKYIPKNHIKILLLKTMLRNYLVKRS